MASCMIQLKLGTHPSRAPLPQASLHAAAPLQSKHRCMRVSHQVHLCAASPTGREDPKTKIQAMLLPVLLLPIQDCCTPIHTIKFKV